MGHFVGSKNFMKRRKIFVSSKCHKTCSHYPTALTKSAIVFFKLLSSLHFSISVNKFNSSQQLKK